MTAYFQQGLRSLPSPPLTNLLTATMLVAGTLGGFVPIQLQVPRNSFGFALLIYIAEGSDGAFKTLFTIGMAEVAFFFVLLRFMLTMLQSTFAIGVAAAVICAVTSLKNWLLLLMPDHPARGAPKVSLDDVLLLSWALEFVGWVIIFTLTVAVVRRLRGEDPGSGVSV